MVHYINGFYRFREKFNRYNPEFYVSPANKAAASAIFEVLRGELHVIWSKVLSEMEREIEENRSVAREEARRVLVETERSMKPRRREAT